MSDYTVTFVTGNSVIVTTVTTDETAEGLILAAASEIASAELGLTTGLLDTCQEATITCEHTKLVVRDDNQFYCQACGTWMGC